jgi:intein/homing endonuclease
MSRSTTRDRAGEGRANLYTEITDKIIAELEDRETFSNAWAAEVVEVVEFTSSKIHIVAGLLLPIWKRLPKELTRVYRLQTETGQRIIGRKVSPAWAAVRDRHRPIDHQPRCCVCSVIGWQNHH